MKEWTRNAVAIKKKMLLAVIILISTGCFAACSKESVKEDTIEPNTEAIVNVSEVKWIDRIEIPAELRVFYDTLVAIRKISAAAEIFFIIFRFQIRHTP